ncbi:MAG: YfhO family protein [Deltaproteobacteria bacterium]|nr:YfhO family protein [Deltaproteobacteria bacterium]
MNVLTQRIARFLERHTLLRLLLWGLFYAGIFLALHPKLYDGESFLGWDIVNQAWPNLEYLAGCISRGEFPLWNPFDKGGFSFVADPETGVFYPVYWVMAGLTALLGSDPFVMLVQVLTHIAIAAVGMHLYLGRHQISTGPRVFASVAYVLSTRLAKSKDQTALGTVVWLPWMAMATEELVRRPSWRTGVLLGSVVGIDLLAGYPPNFFRNVVALVFVFVYELSAFWPEIVLRKRYLKALGRSLLLAMLITAGLAAPVLIGLGSFEETARAQMGLAHVVFTSMELSHALGTITPSWLDPHEFMLYAGLPTVLFALVALLRFDRRRLGWVLAAVFFFLLACGDKTPLLPALARAVPGFNLFRIPEQYLFPAVFFLAVLAARGLEDLFSARDGLRDRLRFGALIITVGLLGVSLVAIFRVWRQGGDALDPRRDLALASFFTALAAGYLAWGLTSIRRHWRIMGMAAAVLVLLLDLNVQARAIYDVTKPWPAPLRDGDLAQLKGIKRNYRLVDEQHFEYRVGLRKRVRDFFGRQTALISKRYKRYIVSARRDHRLLAAANVRYYAAPGQHVIRRKDPKKVKRLSNGILELTDAAPLAYWTPHSRVEKTGSLAFAAMSAEPPGKTAIFEWAHLSPAEKRRLKAMGMSTKPPVAARIVALAANRLELAVNAPAPGVLVINETYAPGWQARLDGHPIKLLRANYLFRAILMDGGSHRLEMLYRPRGILMGISLWGLTVLSLLGAGLVHLWRRRRSVRG